MNNFGNIVEQMTLERERYQKELDELEDRFSVVSQINKDFIRSNISILTHWINKISGFSKEEDNE